MKKAAKFLSTLLAIIMVASTFTAFVQAESSVVDGYYTDLEFASYGGARVNGNVSVFEFKLTKYTGEVEGDRYAAFSIIQNCGGIDYTLDLVSLTV